MDETFHGYNRADGVEPTREIIRVDTLMHSARKAHGDFRIHYSDTVMNTGNGRVWADWAVTGVGSDVLVALPYIGWLSQRHRLPVKFGWLELGLIAGGRSIEPYRVKSWYEASAVPVSELYGGGWQVRAWCAVVPREARLHLQLEVNGVSDPEVVVRGATTLGEEAGSPFDAVNGTVGDREPLPSLLAAEAGDAGFTVSNQPASLSARIECNAACQVEFGHSEVEIRGRDHSLRKQQIEFELRGPLTADDRGRAVFAIDLDLLEDGSPRRGHRRRCRQQLTDARSAWQTEWNCLEPIATPDAQLTAGLKRSAVYAASMLAVIEGSDEAAGLSDHIEWPIDCARDTFHVASSLLLLKPDLARRHLAFTFLDAIPRAGAGKSYVATGESRGHREARLLDLAAYPLLELWRYWRATGDDEFVSQPRVRQTALDVVDEVATWQDPRTGMLTSAERSSDERCVYPCFVPGNAMFVTGLEQVAEMCAELWPEPSRAEPLRELAQRVRQAIYEHAVIEDAEFGRVFAFEVGGAGEFLLYDHADMPNLLSLSRLGFCAVDDPVYRNTVEFAYSHRNQGYRGTADGKYRQLCDGSKTMPFSPWPLGALGQLMSGTASRTDAARLLDWLRDALTPALQLPEICDKHTARPVQRYWFGWPTAMLLMAYVETVCGVKIGRQIRVEPLVPEGWQDFASPTMTVRGHELRVEVKHGSTSVRLDGDEVQTGFPLPV